MGLSACSLEGRRQRKHTPPPFLPLAYCTPVWEEAQFSHFVTAYQSPSVPNKVSVSHREWVVLCSGGTGIGKKGERVETDRAGCSDPRGGVGKAVNTSNLLCPITTRGLDFSGYLYYLGSKVGVLA